MISFTPNSADVERYKRLRAAARRLNNDLIRTVPRRAADAVARALGILHRGVLVFDSEDVPAVFMNCCLYDWIEDGKNLVRRYAERHAPPEGSEEREVLEGMVRARYAMLSVSEAVPGAGVRAVDILRSEELFVMDVGLSRSLCERSGIATRIIPLGEYWMTGGAALPIDGAVAGALLMNLRRNGLMNIEKETDVVDKPEGVLAVVRSCLEVGAADRVQYVGVEEERSTAAPRHALPSTPPLVPPLVPRTSRSEGRTRSSGSEGRSRDPRGGAALPSARSARQARGPSLRLGRPELAAGSRAGLELAEGSPVERAARASAPRIGRNSRCPCGSGKKYKICCGRS